MSQTSANHLANMLSSMRLAGQNHAVSITVTDTAGSSPREPGCKMLVTRDKIFGSIGGGQLEYKIIHLARQTLAQDLVAERSEHIRIPLGPKLGQCCGGVVNMLLEVHKISTLENSISALHSCIYPSDFQVTIFGAGHVGQALVRILGTQPCSIRWIDSRKHIFPDAPPSNTSIHYSEDPEFEVQALAPHTYFVVMTHSHQLDEKIVSAILKRDDSAYCGLIGSRSKAQRFKKRLAARGLSNKILQHLTCPMGDASIKGKHPGEIALSVASELLQINQKKMLVVATPKVARTAQS